MPLELKPLWLLLKHNILSSQTWLVKPIDFDIYSWNANNVTFPWQIPSRVQKFNIIIVKSEITFWISITIFVCLFVFSMHIVYLMRGKISWRSQTVSAGGNFYTGSKSCFMFVVFAFNSRGNRTTSSEISLLPRNFPLELDPKSRLLTIYNKFPENPFGR